MVTAAHIVVVVLIMVFGVLGVVFNSAVVLMSILRSDLKQDYVSFIIGTATANVIYCINIATLQPIVILGGFEDKGILCQLTGFITIMSGTISLLTQPFLALNRYSTLFNREQHSKRFSKRNIIFMILSVYVLSLITSICYLLLADIGRLGDTICALDLDSMAIWHFLIISIIPVSISYIVAITCGVKISIFLKKYENDSRKQEMRTMVRESKQIVKLIFIELFVPLGLECPIIIIIILTKFTTVNPMLISLAIGCFVLHNPTDPAVIVLIVKPYRAAMKKMANSLRNNTVRGTNAINGELSRIQNTNFSNFLA